MATPTIRLDWCKSSIISTSNFDVQPNIFVDNTNRFVYLTYTTFGNVTTTDGIDPNNTIKPDVIVSKLDFDGNIIWSSNVSNDLSGFACQYFSRVVKLNGCIYVLYISGDNQGSFTNNSTAKYVIRRISDSDGSLQWNNDSIFPSCVNFGLTFSNMQNYTTFRYNTFYADSVNNCLLYGYYNSGSNSGDLFIYKAVIDSSNNITSVSQLIALPSGSGQEGGYPSRHSLCVDGSGNLYIAYTTTTTSLAGNGIGLYDIIVTKYNNSRTSPTLQWSSRTAFSTTQSDNEPSICVNKYNELFLVFSSNGGTVSGGSSVGSGLQLVFCKLNTSNGGVTWIKYNNTYNPSGSTRFWPTTSCNSNGDLIVIFGIVGGTGSKRILNAYILDRTSGAISTSVGNVSSSVITNNTAVDNVYPMIISNDTDDIFLTYTEVYGDYNIALSKLIFGMPTTVPNAPTIGTTTPGNQQLTVTWSAPSSNGGATITKYIIYYKENNATNYNNSVELTNLTTLTKTITGLSNGTTYNIKVAAVNSVGTGSYSGIISATPYTTPGAPTISSVVSGNGQLTVSWSAPINNGGDTISSYTVGYSTNDTDYNDSPGIS